MLKKTIILFLAAVLGLSFAPAAYAQAKFKVAIVRMNDRATYLEGQEGVISGFKKAGFDETKVEFEIRKAEDSLDKLAEIAKDLKAKKVDLIIPLGTDAAVGIAKEIKDIPVVFSQVQDPVAAGIVKSLESSGNNVTGTTTWLDMAVLINVLRKVSPVKRLGVLYSGKDTQSVAQKKDIEGLQTKMDFKVLPSEIKASEEAENAAKALVGRVDAVFISGGNTVAKGLEAILEVINQFKIPNISETPEKVEKGVLLAVAGSRFRLGEQAANKAIMILNGQKPSDIPIEPPADYNIAVNLKTSKALGIDIPASILMKATKIVKDK